MKKNFSKRALSAFLAVVMVFLMIPFSVITINAEGVDVSAGDGGYIGKSYNALGNNAFDEDALTLAEIFINKDTLDFETRLKNETNCTYTFVDDFYSYAYNQSSTLDASIDVGTKYKIVKLNANAKYNISESSSSSTEQKTEYFVMEVTHIENTSFMSVTPSVLKNLWSCENVINPDFINSIKTMDAAGFFELYGTHIVTGYSVGGTSYAAYAGESIASNASFSDSRNTAVDLGVDIGDFVDLKGDMNIKQNSDGSTTINNNSVSVRYQTVGGNGNILNLSKDGVNSVDVNNFIDSVTKENSRILLDKNLKMLSIWDFIYASGDKSLYGFAQSLEEYYFENIDGEKEQIGGYSNDFLNYADSKIITTPEELYDIRNNLNGNYVLACNIDLSAYENWEPIGSKLNPFTGRFYGNSNTISGLNITSCTDNVAGLFGYNNGTIYGVRVEGSIAVDGASSVGAVAAYNNGVIFDCYDAVVYDVDYFSLTDVNLGLRKIDLESTSAQTITIDDENGIHLVGQADKTYNGINIVVADNNVESPAYIVLENVNIVGDSANGTIYSNNDRPIYIVSIGTANTISGGASASAINAATTSVTLFGNAEFFVKGGNGKTVTTEGSNGTAGATAIIVDNLIVDMNGELTVVGGDGGNGNKGSYGSYAYNAGNGGNGGDGGMAINCQSISIVNSKAMVEFAGGNGGRGGNGGDIPHGTCQNDFYNIADAGNGGNGGNGGTPILLSSLINTTCFSLTLKYGNGGKGGNGGCGGNPIDGDYCPDGWSNGGNGGNGGDGFTAGNGGNGGQGGGSTGHKHGIWNTEERSTSGNGGNGGDGGNIVSGILYVSGVPQSIQSNVECGKFGTAGGCGPVSGYDGIFGYPGVGGINGTDGITDNSFYDKCINSIIIQDTLNENRMLTGILSGQSNSTNLSTINRSAWHKVNLSIDSVSKTNYFSGDEFDKSTISVSSNGEDVYYDYSFNSQRIGINYVKITDGNCTRLIPVYVTETVPTSIEIIEPGKIEFVKNTKFFVQGLNILVTYNNGTESYLDENSEGVTWTTPSLASEVSQTVTVFYDYDSDASTPTLEDTYNINVVRVKVTHIEVENDPNKLKYAPNEEFNPNGLIIKVFKNDESTESIDATSKELVYIYDFSAPGTCTVTVDYNGHTAYVVCTVTAHMFGDWYTVEEADHNKEGLQRRDCSYAESGHANCFETRVIPMVAHTFDKAVTTDVYKKSDATFTSAAIYYYSCECGAKGEETFTYGEPIVDENAPYIEVDSKNAVIGNALTVKISLKNNPGITSMRINVAYDNELLVLSNVEYNSAMFGKSVLPENYDTLNGNVVLYWANGFVNYEGDGVFVKLTFNVSSDAAIDTTTAIAVTYDAEDIFNVEEDNVEFFCNDGTITFVNYTPGDINGDGIVNGKDTTRLMRYLAGWDVEVNESALDVNGDGAVNGKDTTRLMRYLAGWDVDIF